jgi:hypothetical protein
MPNPGWSVFSVGARGPPRKEPASARAMSGPVWPRSTWCAPCSLWSPSLVSPPPSRPRAWVHGIDKARAPLAALMRLPVEKIPLRIEVVSWRAMPLAGRGEGCPSALSDRLGRRPRLQTRPSREPSAATGCARAPARACAPRHGETGGAPPARSLCQTRPARGGEQAPRPHR